MSLSKELSSRVWSVYVEWRVNVFFSAWIHFLSFVCFSIYRKLISGTTVELSNVDRWRLGPVLKTGSLTGTISLGMGGCDVAVPTRVHPTIIAGQGLSGRATRENTRAEPSFRRDECDRAILIIINSRLFFIFF